MNISCVQVTLAMRLGLTGQVQLPIQVDKTVMSLLVTIQGPVSTALLQDRFGKYLAPQKLSYRNGHYSSRHQTACFNATEGLHLPYRAAKSQKYNVASCEF
jgi:hypothetical protein